jgi:hypothetical protein
MVGLTVVERYEVLGRPKRKRGDARPCLRFGLLKQEQIASWRRWRWWAIVLILGGYLLFCHGCHGDEDTELRALSSSFKTFSRGARTALCEHRG